MKSIITNAAGIAVLQLKDNTYKTGGGPVSVGATAIAAGKGPVGVVTQVTANTWEEIFGKPLPKRSTNMEGLRHLAEAAEDCNYVNVVRVVHEDAKFPSLLVKLIDYKGAWVTGSTYLLGDVVDSDDIQFICTTGHTAGETGPTEEGHENWEIFTSSVEVGQTSGANGHPYGTVLTLDASHVMEVWPIDGDPSTNRSFEIANVVTDKGDWTTATDYKVNDVVSVIGGDLICINAHTASAENTPTLAVPTTNWKRYRGEYDSRFTINFYDKDESGDEYLLETYLVGIDPDDKDDLGRPAFIETVLEQNSDRFRCNMADDLTWAAILESIGTATKTTFAGGDNGTEPDAEEWIDAWDLFRNETFSCDLMFAAGNYDEEVLANCIDIAEERHCSFFFDINPNLQSDAAIDWIRGTGLENRQAAVYYCPFSANDRWYDGKTVWGASGAVAAACAKGDAIMTGAIPGIHYAPAGPNRGRMDYRTGMKPLYPNDWINRDDFYDARINPIIAGDNGGAVIDDCLSIHYKQNYSRFIWINRIANYIDHRFVEAASYMKFEPDGLTRTGLMRLTKEILDQLVVSGALVKPRDPEIDGTEPYKITVEQTEIDLWLVTWDFCPTGAARRIAGQPRLIK